MTSRALRHHRTGNDRFWQHRPSDHLAGQRRHTHGKILPMHQPGFFSRLFTVSREVLSRKGRGRL